jgi:hypothetical protein
MVEPQSSKLATRVRFPSSAPLEQSPNTRRPRVRALLRPRADAVQSEAAAILLQHLNNAPGGAVRL